MHDRTYPDKYLKRDGCCPRHVSLTAIIIGALVGLGLGFLFSLFNTAIGLTAYASPSVGAKTLAIGGLLGLLLTAIFTMGTAGWVAGFLGKRSCNAHNMGSINGFAAWCLALLLGILLSSYIGDFIASATSRLGGPTTAADMVRETRSQIQNTNTNVNSTINDTTNTNNTPVENMAAASFLSFLLFFVGALASAIGGHLGYDSATKCALRDRDRVSDEEINPRL